MQLGSKFGKPVKIDNATSLVTRGHFARICVELEQSKPLIFKFRLGKRRRRVEYEVHLICFACGMYGHKKEGCLTHSSCAPVTSTGNEPGTDNGSVRTSVGTDN